jgi:cation diffusion facilitator family transporter
LLAAVWIAVTALGEIAHPHLSPAPFTLAVLFVVIAIKESLFRFVIHEAHNVESSAVQADAWHHRTDAITSLAAAIGITISLVGGKGYESADDFAALAASVVIAFNGLRMLRPALNELMDRSPNREVVEHICRIAESVPGVHRVEQCRVRTVGYQYYVDMHVEVDPQMTVQQSHEIAHKVKDNVRQQVPRTGDVLVHIEPVGLSPKYNTDKSRAGAQRPKSP